MSNTKSKSRHIQGVKSYGGSYGTTFNGDFYELSGTYFVQQNVAVGVLGSFNHGQENGINYKRMEISPIVGHSPFNVNGLFFLTGYGGLTGRYELFSGQEQLELKNQFNTGALVMAEGEFFIVQTLSLYFYVRQDYMILTPGHWRNVVGVGLRFSIK